MTITELKKTLINNGYIHYTKEEYHIQTNLYHDFYVKNDICISFFKIENKQRNISIYENWNIEKNCGKCLYYDISVNDISDYINGTYKPIKYIPKILENSLPF